MTIYPNAIRDPRVRKYIAPQRILWQNNCINPELLITAPALQTVLFDPEKSCVIPVGSAILLDYGIELHGGVRIVNSAKSGRIRLRFGESASEAMGNPDQTHAIHDQELLVPGMGMLEYGNTAFRFVRIDVLDGDLTLAGVFAVALYRDLEMTGSFTSSDPRLDKIWQTGAYTLLLNLQDYIYDGAKRDRLVWLGDLHPEISVLLSVFSDTSLIPASLDLVRKQTPTSKDMNGIASYSLWWIICQHDYYRHSGDLAYLAEQGDYLDALVRRFAQYIDATGAEIIPGRRFLDWPNNENKVAMHAGLQGLLYWSMRYARTLAQVLQNSELSTVADNAVKSLSKVVPNPGASKAAAAIQTVSGLSDQSAVILTNPYQGVSTFLGYYMLLSQPTQSALDLIRTYWGAMLDYGATTFWEDFDLSWIKNASPISELPQPGKDDLHADFGDHCYRGLRHSLCHGWAAGPTAFLSQRVLGIDILEPGGKTISVTPELGDLTYVKGSFPLPAGIVEVAADASGKVEVKVPEGVELVSRSNKVS